MFNNKVKRYQHNRRNKIQTVSLILIFLGSFIFSLTSCNTVNGSVTCAANSNVPSTDGVTIRADGTTLIQGQPFFPFGFYDVSWESTGLELRNDLEQIADAGFNTIHASATNLDEYGKFLDLAAELNVYVLSERGVDRSSLINAYKDKPAVLGWSIADDVEDELTPEEVFEVHNQVKSIDPNHITYLSGYTSTVGEYANCADVIAVQSYPIPSDKTNLALDSTFDIVSTAESAVPTNGGLYTNVQAFAWSEAAREGYGGSRPPTFQEVRNMTYQALMAGAKGIIYYTFYDTDWKLSENPDLWDGMKTLVPEIEQLTPALLDGSFTSFLTGVQHIFGGLWTYNNDAYVVLLNTSDIAKDISVTLPVEGTGSAEALFENRPSGLIYEAGNLTGTIQPKDVHVYKLPL